MAQCVPIAALAAARRRSCIRWCVTGLVAMLFIAGYSTAFLRDWPVKVWTTMFAPSARRLMAGEILYRHTDVDMYVYPPAIAMQSIPLAVLPAYPGVIAWYLVSVAALVVTIWGAWQLAGLRGWTRSNLWILAGSLVLGGRFLLSPLENHQFDAVIAAILMLGFLQLQRGHGNASGLWLGTAASMKCTPWVIGPYLWGRGQRTAAIVFGLSAICWNVVPDLAFPRPSNVSHLEDWHREVLNRASQTAPGQWIHGGQAQPLNQSLGGLVHRGVTLGVASFPSSPLAAQLSESGSRRWLTWGLSALLVGACWWSLRRSKAKIQQTGVPQVLKLPTLTESQPRVGLEASMVLCLMLLFSPQSSKSHYVVMILPMLVLVHATWQTRNWRLRAVLAGLLLLGPLSVKDVLGLRWGYAALMAGVPTWFVLLSLAGLWQAARLPVVWRPADEGEQTGKLPDQKQTVPQQLAAA